MSVVEESVRERSASATGQLKQEVADTHTKDSAPSLGELLDRIKEVPLSECSALFTLSEAKRVLTLASSKEATKGILKGHLKKLGKVARRCLDYHFQQSLAEQNSEDRDVSDVEDEDGANSYGSDGSGSELGDNLDSSRDILAVSTQRRSGMDEGNDDDDDDADADDDDDDDDGNDVREGRAGEHPAAKKGNRRLRHHHGSKADHGGTYLKESPENYLALIKSSLLAGPGMGWYSKQASSDAGVVERIVQDKSIQDVVDAFTLMRSRELHVIQLGLAHNRQTSPLKRGHMKKLEKAVRVALDNKLREVLEEEDDDEEDEELDQEEEELEDDVGTSESSS